MKTWTGLSATMLMSWLLGYPSSPRAPSLSQGNFPSRYGTGRCADIYINILRLVHFRFVVIPCCFFDLNGSRYQFAEGAPDGKYKAYQGYISRVIDTCGYELQTEVLRIPSTKNIALVGMSRKRKGGSSKDIHAQRERLGEGGDEEEDERERIRRRVDELVNKSGLFVARISDKEKQASQKAKQTAKVAKEATPPPPPSLSPPPSPSPPLLSSTSSPLPSTIFSTSENNNTEDVQQ